MEFKHLTEKHQHNDHRCGLKIDGNFAIVLHRVREQAGHEHCHSAKEECCAHADSNQREHIQVTHRDGTPATAEKWPTCPADHGYGECELHPV